MNGRHGKKCKSFKPQKIAADENSSSSLMRLLECKIPFLQLAQGNIQRRWVGYWTTTFLPCLKYPDFVVPNPVETEHQSSSEKRQKIGRYWSMCNDTRKRSLTVPLTLLRQLYESKSRKNIIFPTDSCIRLPALHLHPFSIVDWLLPSIMERVR